MALKPLVPSELSPPLQTTLITSSYQLYLLREFFSRTDMFGFDVETNMVPTFFHRKIRTIQIGNREEQFVIDLLGLAGSTEALMEQGGWTTPRWATELCDILKPVLESNNYFKLGVNLQFDYETSFWCLGMRPKHLWDCMIVEKQLKCGLVNLFAAGHFSMAALVGKYAGYAVDKSSQTSFDLETPLTQEQIDYGALDTRLVFAIRNGQLPQVQKAKLEHSVRIDCDAIPAFGDMHLFGMPLDSEMWLAEIARTEQKHRANISALDTFFLPVVGGKEAPQVDLKTLEGIWRSQKDKSLRSEARKRYQVAQKVVKEWAKQVKTYEGEAAINYGSTAQLLQGLHDYGFSAKELTNTSDKALSKHSHRPVIRAIQAYRETNTLLSRYGHKFLGHINPDTGRVHPTINLLGADTGRTSSSKPNSQQIAPAFRRCFKARRGYKIITADMSGAELRIIADASKDKKWIEAFAKRWDVHSIGAADMHGATWDRGAVDGCKFLLAFQKCKCPIHKALREGTKAINFGVAYGMEEYSLAERLGISLAEARRLLNLWKQKNSVINQYLINSGGHAMLTLEARTASGRRRLFQLPDWSAIKRQMIAALIAKGKNPLELRDDAVSKICASRHGGIKREGRNMPIQGGNADIIKIAMALMCDRLYNDFGAWLINMVHDELVIECPEDRAEECAEYVCECFRLAGDELLTHVTMEAEYNISDLWEKG